jgi:superfamily II RNA helicase
MTTTNQSNHGFPFELSGFQREAIQGIINHQDVLVSAPTGSGKTLPAEFAIKHFTSAGKKVLYTTPIKSLSNQKYHDFTTEWAGTNISVGLVTGDIQMNPGGDVVVLTTEILRNTLIEGSPSPHTPLGTDIAPQPAPTIGLFQINMDEVACVVFDEFHYICDKHRGHVWEECVMAVPPHVCLVMLSATLSRREELCEWIGRARIKSETGEPGEFEGSATPLLCTSTTRHVPLYHSIWLSGPRNIAKTEKDKEKIKAYDAVANRAIPICDTMSNTFDAPKHNMVSRVKQYLMKTHNNPRPAQTLNDVVRHLRDKQLTPAIVFVLSRAKLEMYAKQITVPLVDLAETAEPDTSPVHAGTIRRKCEQILRSKIGNWQEYQNLPEFLDVVGLLEKGIGIHHAGMLPLIREMVEMLFVQKHIKVLFATETFAVGLNMPTKTTVFTSLKKFDGVSNRWLESAEYTQMAGRAGRRGIDTEGHAIVCANMFEPPDADTMRGIVCGNPRSVVSRLKLSYAMVLEGDTDRLTSQSMLRDEIEMELRGIDRQLAELEAELVVGVAGGVGGAGGVITSTIPPNILATYDSAVERLLSVSGNQAKKVRREISRLKATHPAITEHAAQSLAREETKARIARGKQYRESTAQYIEDSLARVREVLVEGEFVDANQHRTHKGHLASIVRETHPLAFVDTYVEHDGFRAMDARAAVIFLCGFIEIRGTDGEDRPFEQTTEYADGSMGTDNSVSAIIPKSTLTAIATYKQRCEHYATEETRHQIVVPEYKRCRVGHVDLYARWYDVADEAGTKRVLADAASRGVHAGDFVKGVMSVVALAREVEMVCDLDANLETKSHMCAVGDHMLKFIATNQSLYV